MHARLAVAAGCGSSSQSVNYTNVQLSFVNNTHITSQQIYSEYSTKNQILLESMEDLHKRLKKHYKMFFINSSSD